MNYKYKEKESIKWAKLGEGRVRIFNPIDGRFRELNETGALLWDLLIKGCTMQDMIDALTSHFTGIPMERIKEDVERFVARLVQLAYIERLGD